MGQPIKEHMWPTGPPVEGFRDSLPTDGLIRFESDCYFKLDEKGLAGLLPNIEANTPEWLVLCLFLESFSECFLVFFLWLFLSDLSLASSLGCFLSWMLNSELALPS